ncbi:hypothetical protein [Hymenobacter lapidiphilus]|uniref:hypothetical protein n=1 Tax=Hymenobacter sp. CCM 8763 TaxID=2303334 RepID=UPI0011C1480D|nr:hypothetical protein [Hymenobacter sp. CCM 8763]
MHPSSPPPPPSNGVAILMAEIERIAQELRALDKRPLPATEDQVKALVTLAERDRPLTLSVNSEAVAKLLMGKVDQQTKAFEEVCTKLIRLVDDRTDYLNEQLTAKLVGLQQAQTKLAVTIQDIPREVAVNWRTHWKATASIALGPVVLVLLMLWFTGMFSRVPQQELAQAQAQTTQAQTKATRMTEEVQKYQQFRAALAKDRPEIAYKYFPYPTDPKPAKKENKRVKR